MGLQVATTSSSPSTSLTCTVSSSAVAKHLENVKCESLPISQKNLLTSITSTSAIASLATTISARTNCANESCHKKNLETAKNPDTLSSPNVSSPDVMAPALTEPLSPTNKLTSSATSASPRPISNSSSYSLNNLSNRYGDINGNNGITGDIESSTITNNNANFLPAKKAGQLIISTTSGTTGTSTTTSNTVNGGTGAFQLAFEQVVAATSAKQKRSALPNGTSTSNGKVPLLERFEPMCDKNTDSLIIDSISDSPRQQQEVGQQTENGDQNFVVTQVIFANQRMDLDENAEFVGEQQQEQQQQQQNGQDEQMEDQSQQDEPTQELFVVEAIVDQDKTGNDYNMEECEVPNETIGGDESQNTGIITEQCEDINSQESTQTTLTDQSAPVAVANDGTNIVEQQQSQQQQEQQTAQDTQTQVQQNIDTSTTSENMPPNMVLNKDFIKESAEMEQVLGELTSTEMDILQVLKGFDTTPGGDAALCDLAGGLGLFNDVDCMNYEEVGIPAKDPPTREIRNEIEKKQQQMQRKCDFLLRRLKKMQSRFMAKHTSEEIAGLFEWTNRLVRRKDSDRVLSYEDDKYRPVSMASMKAFLKKVDAAATAQHMSVKSNKIVKTTPDSPVSNSSSPTTTSVNSSQQQQQQQDNKTTNVQTSFIPQLDEKSVAEIEHVAGMLQTELKEVQIALDSDVTASSSGGESADEMVTYNNQVQQPLSIAKRAGWRWARDRAEVASRWTWLLTQISDLEYRIRQHTELHNQIKKHKGVVICGQSAPNSNVSETTIPSSVNGYRGVLPGNTKALDTDSVSPNGAYDASGNLSGSCRTRPFQRSGFRKRRLLQTAHLHTVTKRAARSSTIKCGCQWPLHPCALCTGRPDPTAPRDLPDTMPLSERVALLDPGFHPVLSFPEEIHSSAYLEGVMRLTEWQNRVMRCSTKTALKGALAAQKAAEREDRSKKFTDSRRKYNRKFSQDMAANKLKNAKNRRALHGTQFTHLIKNKHRKNSSSNAGASGNTTGNYSGQQGAGFSSTISTPGSDSSTTTGLHFADNNNDLNSAAGQNGLLPRSKNASPTPPGYSSNSIYKNERMDRRSRNSYDIDNIVIPYSVAAATRVEILPYKEIPTPKWRVIDDDDPVENKTDELLSQKSSVSNSESEMNLPPPSATTMTTTTSVQEQNEESEVEDISNEAIQSRHEKALLEERRKFQTYLKFPWSTRSRANRRVDSRTESSGANTPDPTSPAPNTPNVIGGDQESIPSPIAPSTPLTPLETADAMDAGSAALGTTATTASTNNNQSLSIMQINSQLNSARKERKRTVSSKRERDKDETRRSHSPDTRETIPPFEPLPFPLSDEMYEVMLHVMPNDHHILEDCIIKNVNNCDKTTDTKNNSTTSYVINNHRIINNSNTNATIVSQTINRNINSIIYNTSTFDESETLMDGDSDTDSAESGLPDEDPNDPEWREPA